MTGRVLIAGSGIAGQTLACALQRRGIACDLVEIKRGWEVAGAGMYVHSNALRALRDIDVVDDVVNAGWHSADDRTIVADRNGEELVRPRYPRIAGPEIPALVTIRRKALHDVLARAVARCGIAVRMGVGVEKLEDAEGPVRVGFSDGSEGEYDLVVGADGIRSRVRALAFGSVEPVFTGYANWRVILPRPADMTRPLWLMGEGQSFGMVPLSEETLYIAGVSKEPGNPRHPREALPELCRTRFAQFGGPAPPFLEQVREPAQVVYTPIEEIHFDPPWHKGRVVILGDAAHAGTPFWAQGGAMAIEDAVLLARLLDRGEPPAQTLAQWMAGRRERCLFVQRGSLETGHRSHGEGPGAMDAVLDYARNRMQADLDRRYAKLAEDFV